MVIVAVLSVALWRAETVLPALAIVLALRFPWLALAVIGGWTIVERARSDFPSLLRHCCPHRRPAGGRSRAG